MAINASLGSMLLPPRQVGTGNPAFSALENINTYPISNGALCYVETGAAKGTWRLDVFSVTPPDGVMVIAPIAGPGRWINLAAGGGGGSISSIVGHNGINIIDPTGPIVTVDGVELLPLDGSRPMTGNLDMSGNDVVGANSVETLEVTSSAGLDISATGLLDLSGNSVALSSTAGMIVSGGTSLQLFGGTDFLTWPAADGTSGQAIVTDGSGNLSFATVGGGGTPAGPDRSIQFNDGGAFGGQSFLRFEELGSTKEVIIQADGSVAGISMRDSGGAPKLRTYYDEGTNESYVETSVSLLRLNSGTSAILQAAAGIIVTSPLSLSLQGGSDPLLWPGSDGTSGQVLTTDGAGTLSFADASVTLQGAYDAGNTIEIGLNGPSNTIEITGDGNQAHTLDISQNTFNGSAFRVLAGNVDIIPTVGSITIDSSAASPGGNAVFGGVNTTLKGSTNLALQVGAQFYIWPAADGTSGQALVTDGSGNLSFASVAGAVDDVTGSNGISVSPTTGNVVVSGLSLYARDGSNGAMTADVDMGGNGISSAASVTNSTGGLVLSGNSSVVLSSGAGAIDIQAATNLGLSGNNVLIDADNSFLIDVGAESWVWPTTDGTSGQAIVTDGSGNLSFASVGGASRSVIATAVNPSPSAALLEATEITYACDSSGGAFSVTLPNPPPADGTIVRIKDAAGSANAENITIASAASIDGDPNVVIATVSGSYTIQSNGTTYYTI